jgi:hypothetical protein
VATVSPGSDGRRSRQTRALGAAGNAISPPQSHPHQSEGGDGDCRQEWVGWDQAGPRAPERCGAAGWPATGAGQGQGGPPTLGRCGAELRTPTAGPPPSEEVGGAGGHTGKARPHRGRQPPGGGGGTAATPPPPCSMCSLLRRHCCSRGGNRDGRATNDNVVAWPRGWGRRRHEVVVHLAEVVEVVVTE